MKIRLAILTLVLVLSLSVFTLGNETDLIKAIDVDLSVQKSAIFDQEGFLRKKGTNEIDYIFSNNGLWLKSNSDFMVPIIFTGDFEISISVYTVGIFPKANPLAILFPVKTNSIPEIFSVEIWPYITGTEEKLKSALDRFFGMSSSLYSGANNAPVRCVFSKNSSAFWYGSSGGLSPSNFSTSSYWKKEPFGGISDDGLHEVILIRKGQYLYISIDGINYDVTNSKANEYFDTKNPVLLYFRGSKQQGIIPSILEALYIKSIKGVAQEGTFFNIKDVIAAQQ